MSHAPEPWKVYVDEDEVTIDHSGNGSVVDGFGMTEEDARRIVACVNLLAGVPTEDLELYLSRGQQQTVENWPLYCFAQCYCHDHGLVIEDTGDE